MTVRPRWSSTRRGDRGTLPDPLAGRHLERIDDVVGGGEGTVNVVVTDLGDQLGFVVRVVSAPRGVNVGRIQPPPTRGIRRVERALVEWGQRYGHDRTSLPPPRSRPRSGVNETTGVGSPSRATNSSKERTYARACSSIACRPYPPPHR